MPTKKTKENEETASNVKKPQGCRRCKYRVAPPNQKGERIPSCCFGYQINDKKLPTDCGGLFTETDYYIIHPDEP